MRAEVGSSTIRLDLLPFLLSLQSYRRKIRVSWCCFEPCQSKEREKKPPNTPSSHLPPLMCHPVATPGLPQCLAGLWLGTKPLPATSRALGIWSGWHPRAGWGGQVPNPEPRGAKPLHQVHHRGSKTKCGEVLALLQMFFFPTADSQDGRVGWDRQAREQTPDQSWIKTASPSSPGAPQIQAAKGSHRVWGGGEGSSHSQGC